ncbi:uncharacterized protein LOC124922376 isoform X1 [Impatiens glandulifera]|uniref:uncharacterized protein LOC124922376 isoform X1 n=1 Tax=Impatiens glandulifera TaxID=253017 RepID=UPI001FB13066|nr:uncharacterized protein LOC124922376 isoform X1 [Impatiens glandulifera]
MEREEREKERESEKSTSITSKRLCLNSPVHDVDEGYLNTDRSAGGAICRRLIEDMRNVAGSASSRGIVAVVGVGPKLGRSIARKFAHEGYTVAILSRDLDKLSSLAEEIAREEKAQVFAIRIDCSDSRSVKEAFEGVLSLGFVEVLVYNAYQPLVTSWRPNSSIDIPIDAFEKSIAVSSVGPF